MIEQNALLTVQPISVQIDNITLYQDETLLVLSVKNGIVEIKRMTDETVIKLPIVALKVII
ncbi:hypothetical protein NHG25_05870 [Aerococcaceae bacterium NML191292]|nr:hypothetical protein [Aerococcaceae bacterium NML191292]MCW6681887.1 hypothetical protein [Aerococcaceae bacterium NML160702]